MTQEIDWIGTRVVPQVSLTDFSEWDMEKTVAYCPDNPASFKHKAIKRGIIDLRMSGCKPGYAYRAVQDEGLTYYGVADSDGVVILTVVK